MTWSSTNHMDIMKVPVSAFEVIDVSPLIIDPNSGQAHQPY
jgi:hypothetical protein